jgi:hypothetical protein
MMPGPTRDVCQNEEDVKERNTAFKKELADQLDRRR